LTRLHWLGLGGAWQVSDAGLALLKSLDKLDHLELRGHKRVTDTGLTHLTGLTRLKVLDLRGTGVSEAGAARLRKTLPGTEVLR
jgi:hypothetical protein